MQKLTWEEFDYAITKIASDLKGARLNIKNIYGIPRGGLVCAVSLSHRLNVPMILNAKDITNETIIIDDIVDSGNTMANLIGSNDITTVAIYLKYGVRNFTPNIYIFDKEEDWILFPWETENSSKYDGTFTDTPVDN